MVLFSMITPAGRDSWAQKPRLSVWKCRNLSKGKGSNIIRGIGHWLKYFWAWRICPFSDFLKEFDSFNEYRIWLPYDYEPECCAGDALLYCCSKGGALVCVVLFLPLLSKKTELSEGLWRKSTTTTSWTPITGVSTLRRQTRQLPWFW